ncbi:MAG TPA: prepilin-type N-terminal cleavage/methylation domain-containing protein, partial [Verrucomicrobiae bacterium]|nr:prepilin-type N-terminal cleavage/methylation domain-containing protein [Verrucomicrobiae bacterium]
HLSPRAARRCLALPECHVAHSGFTLIELLVVISIIAVLVGLSFPVFQSVQDSAKKTQAKNDLTQIVTAVNAFYTEYGKYPVPAGTVGDGYSVGDGTTPSRDMFEALRGLPTATTLNPRQIVFISPGEDKTQATPKGKIGSDGQFRDPWSSPYVIRIDADYNNQVPNPYGASGGAGPADIRQGVIAWSLGKNGVLGGGAAASPSFAKEPGAANAYTSSGDVISWQ